MSAPAGTRGLLARIDFPPVWLVGFMALAWVAGEVWHPFGDGLVWPGRLLIAAGIALAVWAALCFRRARTTIVPREEPAALVSSGPYRWSRNPIYIADLLILAGFVLTTGQPFALLLLWPFAKVLEARFILPEEALLEARLGDAYRDWSAKVPRWL